LNGDIDDLIKKLNLDEYKIFKSCLARINDAKNDEDKQKAMDEFHMLYKQYKAKYITGKFSKDSK
jgi:hypothetical protein